ncbi:hypothetical protein HID58_080024 [Brassica napus]|uniref:Uncharacterized protein n=1 Tax=Brassica napus TaxID=3708 RepID=A0ABQ7Y681_BRANA|nr:hypothetical protein HID58_080024 [Brassica napus]
MFVPTRPFGELDGLLDPTRRTGELDGSVDPTRPFGELDQSNSTNGRVGGRVGRCIRSNSPLRRIRRWVFRCPGSVVRGFESSLPGKPTRVTAELAGDHNHASVQLAGELTGAVAELAGRVQPHGGSARQRADRLGG